MREKLYALVSLKGNLSMVNKDNQDKAWNVLNQLGKQFGDE